MHYTFAVLFACVKSWRVCRLTVGVHCMSFVRSFARGVQVARRRREQLVLQQQGKKPLAVRARTCTPASHRSLCCVRTAPHEHKHPHRHLWCGCALRCAQFAGAVAVWRWLWLCRRGRRRCRCCCYCLFCFLPFCCWCTTASSRHDPQESAQAAESPCKPSEGRCGDRSCAHQPNRQRHWQRPGHQCNPYRYDRPH